jgi:hypothetical protein
MSPLKKAVFAFLTVWRKTYAWKHVSDGDGEWSAYRDHDVAKLKELVSALASAAVTRASIPEGLVQQLTELDATATPAPWYNDGYRVYGPTTATDKREGELLYEFKHVEGLNHNDPRLVVLLRNALPLILQHLKVE